MLEGTTTGVTVRIPITFEQQVWVNVTAPLSEAGWQRFLEVLAFMKPGLVAPEPAAPTPDRTGGRGARARKLLIRALA